MGEQRGAGGRGQLGGFAGRAGAAGRQAAQQLKDGRGRHGQLAVGRGDGTAAQHRRRGDDARGIERGDQGQHADEVDGGVEAGELVEVLAPGSAVHGAFGGGHARGHRGDAVGQGPVEGRTSQRGVERGERGEAGQIVDRETLRREAAAHAARHMGDRRVDAGRRERRRHDPSERRGSALGGEEAEQRADQHVAARPALALQVEQGSLG